MAGEKVPFYEDGVAVYTEDPGDYFCHICWDRSQLNYKDHVKSINHQLRYHYYYSRFFTDNDNPFVTCNICNKSIGRNWISKHAKSHNLIPWGRPSDELQIYYKNFITKHDDNTYCHVCGIKFNYWYLALSHTDEVEHKTLLASRNQHWEEKKGCFEKLKLSSQFIEFFNSSCVFPASSESSICLLCDSEFEFAMLHITDEKHVMNMNNFLERLERTPGYIPNLEDITSSLKKCEKVETNTRHNEKCRENVNRTEISSSCEVCNCWIEGQSIDEHILSSKTHKKRVKKYSNTNLVPKRARRKMDFYLCHVCERKIEVYNIYFHNKTTEHVENFKKATNKDGDVLIRKFIRESEARRKQMLIQKLPEGILTLNVNNLFICTLCNTQLCGVDDIEGHIQSTKHQEKKRIDRDLMNSISKCIMNGSRAILKDSERQRKKLHREEMDKMLNMAVEPPRFFTRY